MRASSLSNAKIIDLLNHYFIPVHADGVYIKNNSTVPPPEKAAFEHVFQALRRVNEENRTAGKPLLSVGSVHAYVLNAEGKPLDSLHVGEAKPERVTAMLERAIATLKVDRGKPAATPRPQATAPRADPDALVLHLTARYLVPRGQSNARKDIDAEFVPIQSRLGGERAGSWEAVPSEEWLVLPRAEWTKLLPAAPVRVGDTWDLDREVATQLLVRCYPTSENNDLSTNRIDQQALKATILSVQDGVARARIEGSLKMKHQFYPGRDDERFVDETLVGYLDFELDKPRIRTLRLVTDKATYGGDTKRFGAALESVPARSE